MNNLFGQLFNKFRRTLMFVKRILIRKLGLVSDQFFFLDSHMQSQRKKGVKRLSVYSVPKEVSYHGVFNGQTAKNYYPERYVYMLDNASIDPLSGFVYDEDGVYIAECSAWYFLRNFYSWPKPFIRKPRKKFNGQFIYLHDIGYWHWLIEDLPPFLASLMESPNSIILSPKDPSPWQMALLEYIESKENKEIRYVDSPVQVDTLIMTGKTAGQGNPLFGLTPHPKDIAILRQFFQPFLSNETLANKLLFISRKDESRCPINIEEVEAFMELNGYQVINTGLKLSIFEQMQLFSSAKKVIFLHGGALANLVWCKKGTNIIELASQGYLPPAFSMISSICQLEYSWHSYGDLPEDAIEISKLEPFV